jgi:hypothetical protein
MSESFFFQLVYLLSDDESYLFEATDKDQEDWQSCANVALGLGILVSHMFLI